MALEANWKWGAIDLKKEKKAKPPRFRRLWSADEVNTTNFTVCQEFAFL